MRGLLGLLFLLGVCACDRHASGGDVPIRDLGTVTDAAGGGDGSTHGDAGGADLGPVDGGGGGTDLGTHDGGGGFDGSTDVGLHPACNMLAMCCDRLTIPEYHDGCVATVMAGSEPACAELATSPMYCPAP